MRMMVCEQGLSDGHMHHHHVGGHHHHHDGHLRHGHVVGHIDEYLLGADEQEMANIGLIGHDRHHGTGDGCGHLRHRGRKVLGIVFHGGGHMHGPFGRLGGKLLQGKHRRGHNGNKMHGHGHGHHGKHGHGHGHHHGMKRKNKGRHCCGCCLGGQEGTSCVGQAILGQGDDHAADTTAVIPAVDGAATQLITSLLETQLVVSKRQS